MATGVGFGPSLAPAHCISCRVRINNGSDPISARIGFDNDNVLTSFSGAMEQLHFHLTGAYIELHQLLKVTGVCASGGAGKALVAAGKVEVDGIVELRKTCKIRAGQTVRTGDTRIEVIGAASLPKIRSSFSAPRKQPIAITATRSAITEGGSGTRSYR